MSEEEYKKFCKEIIEDETNRLINEKMDSSLIFKYVSALEKKVEKQQKEIENSYKVKFKVGEKAKLADGISIGIMGPNHNKEVFIRKIEIREGYIDYFVDYIKDGEIHNFRCNLQERDLVKLEE